MINKSMLACRWSGDSSVAPRVDPEREFRFRFVETRMRCLFPVSGSIV